MMPDREISPSVGFTPTSEFQLAGLRIEPDVSVPTATVHNSAATATAEPLLDPPGLRRSPYGFFTWPPRELKPAGMLVVRKFAHSVMLALPRITAPASRSFVTRNASRGARQSLRAREPALVCRRSAVAMLSLRKMGIPCSGPRSRPE